MPVDMRLSVRLSVRLSCVVVLLASFVVGCRPRTSFFAFQPVDLEGWSCTDTLRFMPPSATADGRYSLNLVVRFNNHLQYRDLWLVVEQRLRAADQRMRYLPHRDTLHLVVANEAGKWLTPGVVLHEEEAFVGLPNLLEGEALEVLVYHIMREQELQGLTEVGLRMEPSISTTAP